MNARAAIVKAITAHESALADLRAALDALDGAPEARPATTVEWISSGRARQIALFNSPSSVYRLLERHPGVGVQEAPGKPWRIDEAKFRAALRGESGEACGENGDSQIAFALR